MTIKSRKFSKGIRLKGAKNPTTGIPLAAELDGEIRNDEENRRLKVYLESDGIDQAGEREIVTSDQTQELTNKTINGNDNTITNVSAGSIGDLVEDLSVPEAAHDSIPSAKAVQDYVSNTSAASSSDLIYHMSQKSTHGVSSNIVGESDNQTLTNKEIDSASNTITLNADEASVSELQTSNFKSNVIDPDGALTANSDSRIPTQQAVKEYVDSATSGIVSDASGVTYTQNEPTDWQNQQTHVDGSLNELAARAKIVESDFNDHLYGIDPKHESQLISYDNTISTLSAENVKEALDELKVLAGSGSSAADTSYDPSGSTLTDTNVQTAIDSLDVKIESNDVQAHQSFYVCENSGNDLNPGTLIKPFATIQKAIDEVVASNFGGSSAVINVDYGFYNENLILAESYNIMIIGKGMTDTQNCWITGTINLTNSENIKFKNFRIAQSSTTPTIILDRNTPTNTLVDSGGRHAFESCVISNDSLGQKVLELRDGVINDYNVFRECTFVGEIDLTQSSFQNTSVSFIECSSETAPITVSNSILTAVDCYSLGHITHNSGIVALKDIHTMERSGTACIDSTAPFLATNVIYLEDISTYDLLTYTYGEINISSCGYIINACSRNPSVDNITGLRLTMGQRSQDIAYDNTDSGLTATDVKSAIDEVKTLASGGGSGSSVYVSTTDIDENQTLDQTIPLAIPNANITFTSDGSPIEVSLMSSGSSTTNPSFVGVSRASAAQTVINLHLYEGATEVEMIQLQGYSNTTWQQGVGCVKFYVLNPPTGPVTYTLRYSVQSGTSFGSLRKCRMLVKTL